MQHKLLEILRCPVCKSDFRLDVIESKDRDYSGGVVQEIQTGILHAENGFLYPIIDGVPRLLVEAFWDYASFFEKHYPNYDTRCKQLLETHSTVIRQAMKKNRRIKQSFSLEWSLYDYEADTTWHLDNEGILEQFLKEAGEQSAQLSNRRVIDVGCGNGVLTRLIGDLGNEAIGMDMSLSVVRAYQNNTNPNVHFVQGDLQFPPFENQSFDLVHSSGVIHHTNNTELSFSTIHELVRAKGKLCVWLYHPQNTNWVHLFFNNLRRITSKLPIKIQYILYFLLVLPFTLFYKKIIKGNSTNWREEMVDIMDALSPEYRFEHSTQEATVWYQKRNYQDIKISTTNQFGFSIHGRLI